MDKLALRVAARHSARTAEISDPVAAETVEAARFTFPRETYVPKEVRDQPPMVPEGTDLAIWSYEVQGVPYGICFVGKQSKPLWNYRFRNEAERQRRIDETVKDRKSALESKQKTLQERRDYQHDHKVGDIFRTSWGYDETHVEFYEVTEVRGKDLILREIAKDIVKTDDMGTYQSVIGVPGRFIGPPQRVRPNPHGSLRVDGHHASKWDGRPTSETGPYGGR